MKRTAHKEIVQLGEKGTEMNKYNFLYLIVFFK